MIGAVSEKADSWDLAEGDEIAPGRSVLKALGGGHVYEVYLVWDDHLFSLAVAKVLRPGRAEDEDDLEDLGEEAEMLRALAHPVIVRGFGAVLDGPHPHLLIEHLEGPTLRRLIRRHGRLPLEQLLPLAAHVAAALHYMAAERTVHLDVKPDNIVMGMPPRLIDLSIARSFERAARARRPLGTDAYMPPEQCAPAEHEGQIGPPADVWGLGASLHHAVAGEVPFPRAKGAGGSDDPLVRFPQLESAAGPLPGEVPGELSDLVGSMLAPDPAARPTAADVVLALEPLVDALPRKLAFAKRGTRSR